MSDEWYRPTQKEYEWYTRVMHLDGKFRSILDVALSLHMAFTGACDSKSEDIELNAQILKFVLKKWQEPVHRPEFDNAVKSVVLAALREFYKNKADIQLFKDIKDFTVPIER